MELRNLEKRLALQSVLITSLAVNAFLRKHLQPCYAIKLSLQLEWYSKIRPSIQKFKIRQRLEDPHLPLPRLHLQ
jgi:hypothetical protein